MVSPPPARALVRRAPLVAAWVALALGCGTHSEDASGDAGGAETCAVSRGCPDAGSSFHYQTDIVPLLDQACTPCHSPTGPAGYDETTYADVYAQRSAILDQVSGCLMPPSNGPVLTPAQRTAMTQWLECGAPDN